MMPRVAFALSVAVVLALTLAGCATTRPPETIIKTVEVPVPVPVPCVAGPVQRPAFAVDSLPLGSSVDRQMRALRAERKQRIGYEKELEAALSNCSARKHVD